MKITQVTIKQTLKPNTQTVWENVSSSAIVEISEETYDFLTSKDTRKFFRNMGGSESVSKSYTSVGYKIDQTTSTSPTKDARTIRIFEFS